MANTGIQERNFSLSIGYKKPHFGTELFFSNFDTQLGIFLGSGLAMLIGSGIVAKMPTEGMMTVPVFGEIYPWQMIFLYVGIPGLIVALLLFTIKEPARTGSLQKDGETVKPLCFRKAVIFSSSSWW